MLPPGVVQVLQEQDAASTLRLEGQGWFVGPRAPRSHPYEPQQCLGGSMCGTSPLLETTQGMLGLETWCLRPRGPHVLSPHSLCVMLSGGVTAWAGFKPAC